MTPKASAIKALFNAIAKRSFARVQNWFIEHPTCEFAYWASDDFLANVHTDKEEAEFIQKHPEIHDLSDHTTVYYTDGMVTLRTFCPEMKNAIAEMYKDGYTSNTVDDVVWVVEPEDNNYKVVAQRIVK